MTTFKEWWSATLGTVPPLGWRLRDELHDDWLRLHTLPFSKRYPDTEAEYAEVLRRQCAIADEVLGRGQPCWLVVPSYAKEAEAIGRYDLLPGIELALAFTEVVDEAEMAFWSTRTIWEASRFAGAMRAIADDRFRALWASDKGDVYAPYDGGVDLILRPATRVADVRSKFKSWLSAHASGL